MPHSKNYIKTKEGYIVAIEELLSLSENLPPRFYKLDIESACFIYNWTITSGKIGFIEACERLEIKIDGVFPND